MISSAKLISFFLLFGLVAGQPARPNGRDRAFFTPLNPGSGNSRGRRTRTTSTQIPSSQCKRLKIRTLDGRCTHKVNAELGQSRLVHFSYFNVDSREMSGSGLRSPRKISNIVSNQEEDVFSARHLNDLLTFFGQFVDHNVVSTPVGEDEENIPPDSGEHEVDVEPSPDEEELPFRRSERALTGQGEAERPVNVLPSAVDLVAVYGPNNDRNEALREPNSCKLKTSEGDLLPFNTRGFSNSPSTSDEFYFAGDTRANEHPVLTSLHTLWVREHNHLCDHLQAKITFVTPERLYDLARLINIAQFQKVVFEEFFPCITGRRLKRYRGFRRRANPTLSSVFSTAAFRVGHTMVSEEVTKIDADGVKTATPLRENFFVPENVGDGIDPFIRGAAQTKAQEIDVMVVDSLRNFLFEEVDEEEGPDLIALNLQRSRDHNIPSFNEIRRFFRVRQARSFADITSDPDVQEKLAKAYDSVDDVEAWIGMMAEDKLPDSSMGLTMFRVWSREFLRLRSGDQFFYLRRRTIPRILRRSCPEIVSAILDPEVKLFKDIILRNTDIAPEDLNLDDIFKAKK